MTELWRGFENPGPIKCQEVSPTGLEGGSVKGDSLHYYGSLKLIGCDSLRKRGGRVGDGGNKRNLIIRRKNVFG